LEPRNTHARNSPVSNKNDRNTANVASSKVPGDIPNMAECPIKLFATQQDMILRQTKPKNHFCWTHCWTLREMLGLDRNASAATAAAVVQEDGAPTTTTTSSTSTATTFTTTDPFAYDAIEWLVVSNFQIDFTFLVEELPELLSIPTTVVVYDNKLNSEDTWIMCASPTSTIDVICRNPAQPPRSAANPLSVKLPWGCHHIKLFLVGYASGKLRVIVHTANLRYNDIHYKTQGAYLQDFWPKSYCAASTTTASSTSPQDFEETLIAYLKTYHYEKKHTWRKGGIIHNGASSQEDNYKQQRFCTLVELLQTYDFSTALGVLIPSSPGYHKPKDFHKWGYLKVRHAIVQHTTIPSSSSSKPIPLPCFQTKISNIRSPSSPAIVCQFSSIGSLSKKYLTTLEAAWDVGRVHDNHRKNRDSNQNKIAGPQHQDRNLRLVYPTRDEIVRSVEGVMGGGSVPGRRSNVYKPFLQPLYHRWTSAFTPNTTKKKVPRGHEGLDDSDSSDEECNAPSVVEADTDPWNKARNVPHIKTYYQPTPDGQSMAWFVLSSHNLSKGTNG
jgi:tyrosyl-DNA phosphodiesterase 1